MRSQAELWNAAAEQAMTFVRPNMIIGLGTGRTVGRFLTILAHAVSEGMNVWGVPTSFQTAQLSKTLGIPLRENASYIDLTVDGADAVDGLYRILKGGGGALTREKIVASQAHKLVIIVDQHKVKKHFANLWLPLEVLPFRQESICEQVKNNLGRDVVMVKRVDHAGTPISSDNGNALWDLRLPKMNLHRMNPHRINPHGINLHGMNPHVLAQNIASIPGIVEHGLFLDMADHVIVAKDKGVHVWNRNAPHNDFPYNDFP